MLQVFKMGFKGQPPPLADERQSDRTSPTVTATSIRRSWFLPDAGFAPAAAVRRSSWSQDVRPWPTIGSRAPSRLRLLRS